MKNSILEKMDEFITDDYQEIFNRGLDFILNLNTDKLKIEQLDNILSIINHLEKSAADNDLTEIKRAKKSLATIKQYGRAYYRKNKIRLKARKRKIKNSVEGKKRARNKDRNAKAGKTPSGRKKILYNTSGHSN